MFRRLEQLIGTNINKLHNSNIIIFGVGGVGGYVAEMLVRSGIGNLTIVDYDTVDISNKNRQIIALDSTIGKSKVEVWKDRILDINPNCNVKAITNKLTPDNIEDFDLAKYNYIIDAIDMVCSKVTLIEYAYRNKLKIISAMGAGNRIGIPEFIVDDIYNTYNDGLAKVVRSKLRRLGVESHKVVYTKNMANSHGDTIGSIAYYPAMCGCVLSAYVIEEILGEGNGSNNK